MDDLVGNYATDLFRHDCKSDVDMSSNKKVPGISLNEILRNKGF